MSRFSHMLAAIGTSALLVTALAAPAAAVVAPEPGPVAHVTVVQGIPGEVDICVGGKEIASNVRFGKWASRTVTVPRVYKLRVFRPDPRECAGKRIISRKVELWPGRVLSMVLKLRQPRVVMFDLGKTPAAADSSPYGDTALIAVRHAARARNVEMRIGYGFPVSPVSRVAADVPDEPWNAGDELMIALPDQFEFVVGARRDGQRLVRPKFVPLFGGKLHEVFLVGWNKATYRWVVVRTPLKDLEALGSFR